MIVINSVTHAIIFVAITLLSINNYFTPIPLLPSHYLIYSLQLIGADCSKNQPLPLQHPHLMIQLHLLHPTLIG